MNMIQVRHRTGPAAVWARIRAWHRRHSLTINLGALLVLFVVVALWQCVAVVVPAGHVAVKWHRFGVGTDTHTIFGEGTHFNWPWDKIAVYDARLQQFSRDFDVLTRDGMTMTVNIAFRCRLNEEMVGLLHKHVGPDYVDILLVPTVGSFARIVFSKNTMEAIYTDRRSEVQDEIRQAVMAELNHDLGQQDRHGVPWLFMDDILIRSMSFPPDVQAAVNRKMEQRQIRDEYTYRLQREELESQRKEVEAQGIARFQRIVGAGISDTYLRWKGIDATLALAQSPNTKIVVIGTGKDGMPLILGGVETPAASTPPSHNPAAASTVAPPDASVSSAQPVDPGDQPGPLAAPNAEANGTTAPSGHAADETPARSRIGG